MITLTRGEAQNVLNLLILWLDEQEEPDTETAIETLRVKLSEPPCKTGSSCTNKCERCGEVNPAEIHTCTPKREWVGLTDEDKNQIAKKAYNKVELTAWELAQRVGEFTEAKLKEKNA